MRSRRSGRKDEGKGRMKWIGLALISLFVGIMWGGEVACEYDSSPKETIKFSLVATFIVSTVVFGVGFLVM